MEHKTVLILATDGDSTRMIYHALVKHFDISSIILEQKESRKVFIKRRLKKLGLAKVTGQLLFQVLVAPVLKVTSRNKVQKIVSGNGLCRSEIPEEKIVRVNSINSSQVEDILQEKQPDVVIVNGTRIISRKILNAATCVFINSHTGITPRYRGVHGGYWALANGDKENCGVTVHLLDEGIDTGEVLYQEVTEVTEKDNFVTYPYLQTAKSIPLLVHAVNDAFNNRIKKEKIGGKSQLWYHPTMWDYLYNRLIKKVK
ncbi:MAG: formyl transferase [Ferruginibacter sp.]